MRAKISSRLLRMQLRYTDLVIYRDGIDLDDIDKNDNE